MIKGLEETSNGQIKLPADLELLESEQVNKYLQETCEKFDVNCPPPQTTTRLLDKVQSWLASLLGMRFPYKYMLCTLYLYSHHFTFHFF